MKKLLLSLALLALLAAPSFAYVQSGHLIQGQATNQTRRSTESAPQQWTGGGPGQISNPVPEPIFEPLGEPVTRPIPEPGTMALASLGLLALGAARARRRGR